MRQNTKFYSATGPPGMQADTCVLVLLSQFSSSEQLLGEKSGEKLVYS